MTTADDVTEVWCPVGRFGERDFPNYEVSSLGRVRNRRGLLMKPRVRKDDPYLTVRLRGGAKQQWGMQIPIHRLVLSAFVGPLPEGLVSRHLNGNAADNRLDNLAYGTQKENVQDAIRHGTFWACRARNQCRRGHELTPDNSLVFRDGRRRCRTCIRAGEARRRAA
jgi:hypothetical protein